MWIMFAYCSMDQGSNAMVIRHHLMEICRKNAPPVVLKNLIADWPASTWTPDNIQLMFENEPIGFRIGNASYNGTILQFVSV